jgi:glutathione S-transferase
MHTLFYSPGYCSMSAHICLIEAGLSHRLVRVDLKTQTTDEGKPYPSVNAKGYVPALQLPDGQVLTETASVLQYIADRVPGSGLAPVAGSIERYRLQEWLNFLATEIHKRASLLVSPHTPEAMRVIVKEQLAIRLSWMDRQLVTRVGLLSDGFTVADAHLFFLLHGFDRLLKYDLSPTPELARVFAQGLRRASVREAMTREGLKVAEVGS